MSQYETTGAWSGGDVERYCAPGPWVDELTPDPFTFFDSIYLEYRAVAAVLDLATGSVTELDLGHNLRSGRLATFFPPPLAALGRDSEQGLIEHPKRMAGYEDGEAHRVYLHYLVDDGEDAQSRLHILSGEAVVASVEESPLVEPGEFATFAGSVATVDQSEIRKI